MYDPGLRSVTREWGGGVVSVTERLHLFYHMI